MPRRLPQRAGEALESALGDVMIVLAVQRFDVQRDSSSLREGMEPVLEHLGIHLAEPLLAELGVPHQPRTTGDVERDAGQRLVHRGERIAVAADAALVAQRLRHRLADRDAGVLHRMMLVDMQIALRADVKVDQRVAGELLQHVIEEADAGFHLIQAGAVEIDGDGDVRLAGGAGDGRGAHGALHSARAAFGKESFA